MMFPAQMLTAASPHSAPWAYAAVLRSRAIVSSMNGLRGNVVHNL